MMKAKGHADPGLPFTSIGKFDPETCCGKRADPDTHRRAGPSGPDMAGWSLHSVDMAPPLNTGMQQLTLMECV